MRIIAGEFRGRRLVAPKGMATRPTTDRAREAWFSIIGRPGPLGLDLYAGTGALGFEALSRGAERVVFVEKARPAAEAIRKNAETLGAQSRVTLLASDLQQCAGALRRTGPFDLIVADPPWTDLDRAIDALTGLITSELVAPEGLVVLGHPKNRPIDLPAKSGLEAWKRRAWGDSGATFYVRQDESADREQPERA
jgi:16S rRNA (guanine966-N2)-methyltransferase